MSKTFVLVHGAWVGEWCFDPIIPLLEAKGDTPLAVSLTGFGKKRDLHNPNLTVCDHIQDVVDFVETHDLHDFVLVGHSYGGAVITGAWDQLRNRVAEVIYVDASTPADGESQQECVMRFGGESMLGNRINQAISAGQAAIPFPIEALEKHDPERAAFMRDKVMPQPIGCLTTPIRLKNGPLPADIPKTFILALLNPGYHHNQVKALEADKSWHIIEVNTGHNVMFDDPVGLVEILTN